MKPSYFAMLAFCLGCGSDPFEGLGGRAEDSSDFCLFNGLYGNGACDESCPDPDPDCEEADDDTALADDDTALADDDTATTDDDTALADDDTATTDDDTATTDDDTATTDDDTADDAVADDDCEEDISEGCPELPRAVFEVATDVSPMRVLATTDDDPPVWLIPCDVVVYGTTAGSIPTSAEPWPMATFWQYLTFPDSVYGILFSEPTAASMTWELFNGCAYLGYYEVEAIVRTRSGCTSEGVVLAYEVIPVQPADPIVVGRFARCDREPTSLSNRQCSGEDVCIGVCAEDCTEDRECESPGQTCWDLDEDGVYTCS